MSFLLCLTSILSKLYLAVTKPFPEGDRLIQVQLYMKHEFELRVEKKDPRSYLRNLSSYEKEAFLDAKSSSFTFFSSFLSSLKLIFLTNLYLLYNDIQILMKFYCC